MIVYSILLITYSITIVTLKTKTFRPLRPPPPPTGFPQWGVLVEAIEIIRFSDHHPERASCMDSDEEIAHDNRYLRRILEVALEVCPG